MASSTKGLKPWQLTEEETFASYGKWQSTLLYCLNKEVEWQRFLKPVKPDNKDTSWEILIAANPTRGLSDDGGNHGKTKEEKVLLLNNMLEYIAQWAPHFISHEIIKESTSMRSVWQTIRQYYNLQQSEGQFLKLALIKWEGPEKERPERLYRRILSHLKDNLLRADSLLQHNKAVPTKDEDISPTVERLAVFRWLELIDARLPMLVARTFATDLESRTLKDIQPQIANAMDSLLEQLRSDDAQLANIQALQIDDDIQAAHVSSMGRNFAGQSRFSRSTRQPRPASRTQPFHKPNPRSQPGSKQQLQCSYCQGWKRPFWGHTMANCQYISEAEKRDLTRGATRSYRVEYEALPTEDDVYSQDHEYEGDE
jgi:hypothetical protein